jgi:SAM-dependent methyltransferase
LKFIHSKDENFEFIKKQIPEKFDVIFLDTLHEADHVEKILYNYYDMLKINGYFIVDDISWIPYLRNSWRDNFNLETENRKTFELLVDIFLNNQNNIKLDFSFTASGLAKISKISDNSLNKKKHINSRIYSLRYFLKKIKKFITN